MLITWSLTDWVMENVLWIGIQGFLGFFYSLVGFRVPGYFRDTEYWLFQKTFEGDGVSISMTICHNFYNSVGKLASLYNNGDLDGVFSYNWIYFGKYLTKIHEIDPILLSHIPNKTWYQ